MLELEEIQDPVIKQLSAFHKGVARRIAEGKRGRDICKEMKLSASRLSILKTSPLMKKAIYYYEGIVEKGFEKAKRRLDDNADEAAKVIVEALKAKDSEVDKKTKAQLGFGLLDRLGIKTIEKKAGGVGKGQMLFEQTLRIVKNESLDKSSEDNEFNTVVDTMLTVP